MIKTSIVSRTWATHKEIDSIESLEGVTVSFHQTDGCRAGRFFIGFKGLTNGLWINLMTRKDLKVLRDFLNDVLGDLDNGV